MCNSQSSRAFELAAAYLRVKKGMEGKPHESGRIRVSPLYGDVMTWPKYSKDERNLSHSSD